MIVESETEEITALRRRVVQMLFAEGNHYCPFCEKSGNLPAPGGGLSPRYGGRPHYPQLYPHRELDASHPDVLIDHDRMHPLRAVRAREP